MVSPHNPKAHSALRISGAKLASADRVLVLVPGALTPLHVFAPLAESLRPSNAMIQVAFPGMDGRPLDEPMRIYDTARAIANTLRFSPAARVDLVGLSAGAAICLEVRGLIADRKATTALIAAPAPAPALVASAAVFGCELARILLKNRHAPRSEIWREAFQILLQGHGPQTAPEAGISPLGPSVTPTFRMLRYHGLSVCVWRPSRRARLADTPLRFYHGAKDTISRPKVVERFAHSLSAESVTWYPHRAHLPHLGNQRIFDDIARFHENAGAS